MDEAEAVVELLSSDDLCQSDLGPGLSTVRERVEKLDGHVVIADERINGRAGFARLSSECCGRSGLHRKDSARELKTMRARAGSNIAQDRSRCDVSGMPGDAAALQVAALMLAIGDIADESGRIAQSLSECGTTS